MELDIINQDAAGIDVGSRSHYAAVGQSLEDVKEFGVYAEDLTALCLWLLSYGITSVAMESTFNTVYKQYHLTRQNVTTLL